MLLDLGIIVAYFAAIMTIGVRARAKKKDQGTEEYFLSSREIVEHAPELNFNVHKAGAAGGRELWGFCAECEFGSRPVAVGVPEPARGPLDSTYERP